MKTLLLLLSLVVSGPAIGSQCNQLYPNGQPIVVTRATELCNSFYVSVFDTQNKAAIFSSELLKKNTPVGKVKRIDSFRSDDRIQNSPANADYKGMKYDKGHMAPADDASTVTEMRDSFLLTNVTPQLPTVNRISWKGLEEKVRIMYGKSKSDVYVLTIAVYDDNPKLMNSVPIPVGYWKVVYIDNKQLFFYAPNVPNGQVVQKQPVEVKSLIK
jgi:endonuclease G